MQLFECDLTSAEARALIAALDAELQARYPEDGANHFRLDADEVSSSRGAFLVARRAERALGCAAVRLLDATTGEVKRMYVAPDARRQGVGALLLTHIEAHARRLGATRLVLETGARQPESLALYRRFGFSDIERFGEYVSSPLSLCLTKALVP